MSSEQIISEKNKMDSYVDNMMYQRDVDESKMILYDVFYRGLKLWLGGQAQFDEERSVTIYKLFEKLVEVVDGSDEECESVYQETKDMLQETLGTNDFATGFMKFYEEMMEEKDYGTLYLVSRGFLRVLADHV